MSMDNLNKWLTLAANFGVIAGILFLAFEIRQNTRTMQAAAIQESTNIAREQLYFLAGDSEMARIERLGDEDPSQLTPEEYQRYFYEERAFWIGMQSQYRQWELGILPDEEWGVWSRVICGDSNFGSSGDQALWESTKSDLIPAFTSWVESNCNQD